MAKYEPPSGYHEILNDGSPDLPENWKILMSEKGRKAYQTPPPRTLILRKRNLLDLQEKGQYKDVDADKLQFSIKYPKRKKNSEHINVDTQLDDQMKVEDEIVPESSSHSVACHTNTENLDDIFDFSAGKTRI